MFVKPPSARIVLTDTVPAANPKCGFIFSFLLHPEISVFSRVSLGDSGRGAKKKEWTNTGLLEPSSSRLQFHKQVYMGEHVDTCYHHNDKKPKNKKT